MALPISRPSAAPAPEAAARRPLVQRLLRPHTPSASLRLPLLLTVATLVTAVIALAVVMGNRIPTALVISAAVLTAVGAIVVTTSVFRLVEQGEARLLERNRQLAAVQVAATSLSTERELRAVLERTVELSREITQARYGALAVRKADGSIQEFITSGISERERELIGEPPTGRGLLGVIIDESTPLRLRDITADPRSAGFPPHHPPMKSLLGVPVVWKGRTIGNLYLTDKIGRASFSEDDEDVLRIFAAHAAVAVENMRLQDELRALAVLEERERIGMDLHDGIIQSIYAVGLALEAVADDVPQHPDRARRDLDAAIEQLNGIIRDVRSYIFELRPTQLSGDLAASLVNLAEDFRVNSLVETSVTVAPDLPPLSDVQRAAVFHTAKEAFVNARKHARATAVSLSFESVGGAVRLRVRDNGAGFEPSLDLPPDHRGLRNMASRAREAGGTLRIDSSRGGGTSITMEIPVSPGGTE